jgi:hypothetical protein
VRLRVIAFNAPPLVNSPSPRRTDSSTNCATDKFQYTLPGRTIPLCSNPW